MVLVNSNTPAPSLVIDPLLIIPVNVAVVPVFTVMESFVLPRSMGAANVIVPVYVL